MLGAGVQVYRALKSCNELIISHCFASP